MGLSWQYKSPRRSEVHREGIVDVRSCPRLHSSLESIITIDHALIQLEVKKYDG
jgi:hypothetical protein